MRVSPPKVFPVATRSAKPSVDVAGSADAYRQTSFVLGEEVELVLRGLNLEGLVAAASAGAKFRSQQTAAALGLWSRSWLCRIQALHAAEWGGYSAAMPLVRAAADYSGGMVYLLRQDAVEWEEWLEGGGVSLAAAQHATEFRLHTFRAAEALAGDETLGPIYRAATDLSLPHFGATLLLAGGDSGPDHVAMTFGDRDFHVAFAELLFGWLVELSAWHLRIAAAFRSAFGALESVGAGSDFLVAADTMRSRPTRCRIEHIDVDGSPRYLVHNLRRAPGAAPKRVLL